MIEFIPISEFEREAKPLKALTRNQPLKGLGEAERLMQIIAGEDRKPMFRPSTQIDCVGTASEIADPPPDRTSIKACATAVAHNHKKAAPMKHLAGMQFPQMRETE